MLVGITIVQIDTWMFRHQIDHDINVIYLLVGITVTWWPPTSKIAFEVEEPWCTSMKSGWKTSKRNQKPFKTPYQTGHSMKFLFFEVGVTEGSKQFLKIRSVSCVFFVHPFWQLHLLSELHAVSMLNHLKIESALELNMFMTFHVILITKLAERLQQSLNPTQPPGWTMR